MLYELIKDGVLYESYACFIILGMGCLHILSILSGYVYIACKAYVMDDKEPVYNPYVLWWATKICGLNEEQQTNLVKYGYSASWDGEDTVVFACIGFILACIAGVAFLILEANPILAVVIFSSCVFLRLTKAAVAMGRKLNKLEEKM